MAIHICGWFSVIPYMPVLKVMKEDGRIVCGETWEISSRRCYTLSLFMLQYGIPVPLLVVFYARTWFIVFRSNKKLILSMLDVQDNPKSVTKTDSIWLSPPVNDHQLRKTALKNSIRSTRGGSLPELKSRSKSEAALHLTKPLNAYFSPLSASPAESKKYARKLRVPAQRQRSYSASPLDDLDDRKPRTSSEAWGRRISRYFSVTGGMSLTECQQVTALKQREKQTRRLLVRFTIITSVFIVCMLPNQIQWILMDFFDESFDEMHLVHLVTYANCVINPLLYGHYDRQFRENFCKRISNRTVFEKIENRLNTTTTTASLVSLATPRSDGKSSCL